MILIAKSDLKFGDITVPKLRILVGYKDLNRRMANIHHVLNRTCLNRCCDFCNNGKCNQSCGCGNYK